MRRLALALLLGCLLLVAGASALDGYYYYQTIEYAGCDQETYQQDIVIHRSTGTAYNETAGGLETWHIFVGDHCREDYGDVRFTNSTGAELAYYLWPDYDATSARICVRLEGATSAGALTVWYGNPAAATTSSRADTFLFSEMFPAGPLDPEKWTEDAVGSITDSRTGEGINEITGGTSSSGSYWVYDTTDTGNQHHAKVTLPASYTIEWENSLSNTAPSGLGQGGVALLTSANKIIVSAGHGDWRGNSLYSTRDIIHERGSLVRYNGYTQHYTYPYTTKKSAGNSESVPIQIRVHGNDVAVTIDNELACTFTKETAVARMAIVAGVYGGCPYVSSIGISNLRVRAYSATPPAALTFSGEQVNAAPPRATFTATPTAGLAPLTVQFTDTSTGHPTSWSWTFGDSGTSTAQNPQHTYTTPGTHTVTLTATNEYGSDEEIRTDYITVYGPVTAQFTANITGGTAPLTVQFTDLSTGGPTSWLWSFGDGNTSTAQNPQHTYTTAGAHTVTLTASHPYDSDTETKTSYITVAVLQPFPGLTNIPRDLAGNGLYTDINGNNRLDYNDLTVFFQHLAWAKTAQPIACFDFNGNGWLDYNDVITLFSTIMEEHT